jgi:DNA primase
MTVEDLLISKQIPYIPKGKDFVVKCLNPEHADRNPSMRIDKITGIFNCFSCEYKGSLFFLFGEKANQLQIKKELLKKKIREKRAESIGLSMPSTLVPYVGTWRDLQTSTYKKFEAFQSIESDFIGRIVFPIRDISGRIVAFNGRHTTGGSPKYLISPSGARMPLFPALVDPIKETVIIVEGIYDMLNLHDKGLTNAVCCFGTKNINEDKLSLLKLRGVESLDIFFDGDEAGQKAAEKVKIFAEKVGLHTRNINIPDTDPGELSLSVVNKLKQKLYS